MNACAYCDERPADGPDGFCRECRIAHGAQLVEIAHHTRKLAAGVLYPKLDHGAATAKLREAGWSDAAIIESRVKALRDGCPRCFEPFDEEANMELFATTQAEPFTYEETVWAHG